MRKVLIAPLLFVTMIVLIIWVIYPLYTKDLSLGGGIKEKRALILEKQTRLSSVDGVMQNVESLYSQLNSNSSDARLLFDYVSKNREEEKLIESINALAKGGGLFVLNISVTDVKNSDLPDLEYAKNSISIVTLPDGSVDPATDPERLLWEKMKKERSTPRELAVKVLVVGEYAKIKSFINQMYGFKRFNQLSSLTITTNGTSDSGESSNLLQASLVFEFNYVRELEKISDFDIEDPVFASRSFDLTPLETVWKKSVDVRQVELRQDGTANPFFK